METDDIWVTRDGQEIPVTDMSDQHLCNAISWCKRNEERISGQVDNAFEFASSFQGEMATYYAEQMADRAVGIQTHFQASYRMLLREAKRRWGP